MCDYLPQQRQDLTKRYAELAAKNADAMRRAEAAEEEVPRSDWLMKNARIFATYWLRMGYLMKYLKGQRKTCDNNYPLTMG